MKKLIVIVGPTGAGKTQAAIRCALHLGAEIISADSQQVYRGMDIGTGKASLLQQSTVAHHLLDVIDPQCEMTAAQFVTLADACIEELTYRETPAIVAGGTMLYVRALLHGLFEGPAKDEERRTILKKQAAENGPEYLWKELEKVDTTSASKIHMSDERRLIRALEVYQLTGLALSEHHQRHQAQPPRYDVKMIGIQPERQALYDRIDTRVLAMLEEGWVDEVRRLRSEGIDLRFRSQQAIGYREIHQMLEGLRSEEETVSLIQRNSRRYARRQMSWYRGDSRVSWLEGASMVDLEELQRYLGETTYD